MTQSIDNFAAVTGAKTGGARPGRQGLSAFLGDNLTVINQSAAGFHLRNNLTGDILYVGIDAGINPGTGENEVRLAFELNGHSLPGEPPAPDDEMGLPLPWKLWQEDDDPLGSYFTLHLWPLTLVIDPHRQQVMVQVTDIDRPVATRTGFGSLAEARQIALELATRTLTRWLINVRQAFMKEVAAETAERPDWHFEQYGDTDDPSDGYYRRHVGPLQLAIDPASQLVILDVFDPDFTVAQHGFVSLDQAKALAGRLLTETLTAWQSQSPATPGVIPAEGEPAGGQEA